MKKKQLFTEVEKILWEDWDPIGINGSGGSSDEYGGYVSSIVALLMDDQNLRKITQTLHQHANVNMGLSSSLEDHIETAKKLITLKNG